MSHRVGFVYEVPPHRCPPATATSLPTVMLRLLLNLLAAELPALQRAPDFLPVPGCQDAVSVMPWPLDPFSDYFVREVPREAFQSWLSGGRVVHKHDMFHQLGVPLGTRLLSASKGVSIVKYKLDGQADGAHGLCS
eukprot:4900078-Amphidinium_carterae.1